MIGPVVATAQGRGVLTPMAQGRGPGINWWDPNDVGLSVIGAYRAINSIGTPWPGGPTAYLQTLVNQAFPGVNDLVEGNGAMPWVQATGWGFVTAAAQWFDTGLLPVNDQSWSCLVQFANGIAVGVSDNLFGSAEAGGPFFLIQPQQGPGAGVLYANGAFNIVAPVLAAGNLGIAGTQGYRNGAADGGAIAAAGGVFGSSIAIGGVNRIGIVIQFITADIESVAIYDGGPAAVQAEAAAIVAAMAAL